MPNLLVVGAGRLTEPPREASARAQYPSLAQVAGHALSSIFLDSLAVDIERLNRINLTLSLLPSLVPQIVTITGFSMGVNYGTEKVRFPSPVPVGARVRAGASMESATPFNGGIAMNLAVTMEIEGGTKPAMVATVVYRRYV